MSTELLFAIGVVIGALGATGLTFWAALSRLPRIERALLSSADATAGLTESIFESAKATSQAARAISQIAEITPQTADALSRAAASSRESADRLSRSYEQMSFFVNRESPRVQNQQNPIVVPIVFDQFDIGRATEFNNYLLGEDGKAELNEFLFSEWSLQAHILDFEEKLFDGSNTSEEFFREHGISETPEKTSSFKRVLRRGKDGFKHVGKKTFETLNSLWKKGVGKIAGSGAGSGDDD